MFISRTVQREGFCFVLFCCRAFYVLLKSLKGNKTKDISWPVNMKYVYLQVLSGRCMNIHTSTLFLLCINISYNTSTFLCYVWILTQHKYVFCYVWIFIQPKYFLCVLCMNISTAQVLFCYVWIFIQVFFGLCMDIDMTQVCFFVCFSLNLNSSAHSHPGSLFSNEDLKRYGSWHI